MHNARIPLMLLLGLAVGLASLAAEQMSVAVRQAPVRDRASFTGKVIATLAYGDRVTIEEVKGDWLRISHAPKSVTSGWVSRSALQTQEIALKAGDKAVGTSASSGEVALAGKGFSEEVEAEYRKDKKLNYAAVDEMTTYQVSPEAVAEFIAQGGLAAEGGTP